MTDDAVRKVPARSDLPPLPSVGFAPLSSVAMSALLEDDLATAGAPSTLRTVVRGTPARCSAR